METASPALRRVLMLAAPLAVAAALAGCSASSSTSGNPPGGGSSSGPRGSASASIGPAQSGAPNSCNVITMAEAGAALGGQPVKPPIRGHAYVEGGVACVYYGPHIPPGVSPDVPVGDSVRVVLVVGPKAKKYFDDYRGKVHARAISGLGDAAFYDGFASISVLKGDAYLRIAVGVLNPLPPEEALARDALPRM
jgi:hypothetical protein